jgi:hypothetical protein
MNLKIRFQGEEYIVVDATKLEDGGAMATPTQFKNGECSYAHIIDGKIMRFMQQIGTVSDIEVIGTDNTEPNLDTFLDGWIGDTWPI